MVVSLPKEKRLLRLELKGLGRLGEALAEDHGKPVFVFGGIPGETVQAEVVREHRGYLAARVVEVVTASPHRVAPPCPYFGPCTGCQRQHIEYSRQLQMKRALVEDALERVGGLSGVPVEETLPSPEPWGYRNHARFTVGSNGRMGFVNRESRELVDVDECLLMDPWINGTLKRLQGHVQETTQLSIRYGKNTGSAMVQPKLHNPGLSVESGQRVYEEALLGERFQVASPSFFQVNSGQAERLALLLRESLALTGAELVVDAYAGVGTFAVLLASQARHIIAIEESPSALEDARRNTADKPNVELRRGKVEKVLAELALDRVDAVVLDPPRTGCQPAVLRALIAAAPRRIVYVSCDPESLARDLKVLAAGPFRIERVQPLDIVSPGPTTWSVWRCLPWSRSEGRRWRPGGGWCWRPPRLGATRSSKALAFPSRQRRWRCRSHRGATSTTTPVALAEGRAREKALAAARGRSSGTVIGADTVVALAQSDRSLDGVVLGKPRDAADAVVMLRELRGREHRVVTGVALVDAATGETLVAHRSSRVLMREYSEAEIEAYVATGDPLDKAGAYAVQSASFRPAAEVRGCYLNVVGLPVCTLMKLLERFGVSMRLTAATLDLHGWDEWHQCRECVRSVAGVST